MKNSWRTKLATLTLGASLALVAPQATAAPGADASATGQVQSSTTAASSTQLPSEAAPQALPCGFSFWNQSYNNCRDNPVVVHASAYESPTRKWYTLNLCYEPGQTQVPMAPWGMLVFSVGEFDANSC